MKSQFDFFQIREVCESDKFADFSNIGMISPIKVRFRNDCKFSFVYGWTFVKNAKRSIAMFFAKRYNLRKDWKRVSIAPPCYVERARK